MSARYFREKMDNSENVAMTASLVPDMLRHIQREEETADQIAESRFYRRVDGFKSGGKVYPPAMTRLPWVAVKGAFISAHDGDDVPDIWYMSDNFEFSQVIARGAGRSRIEDSDDCMAGVELWIHPAALPHGGKVGEFYYREG